MFFFYEAIICMVSRYQIIQMAASFFDETPSDRRAVPPYLHTRYAPGSVTPDSELRLFWSMVYTHSMYI